MSGDQNHCVSSTNYPNNYPANEFCDIEVLQDSHIEFSDPLEYDGARDSLEVAVEFGRAGYYYDWEENYPSSLAIGEKITWQSTENARAQFSGWQICFIPEGNNIIFTKFILLRHLQKRHNTPQSFFCCFQLHARFMKAVNMYQLN